MTWFESIKISTVFTMVIFLLYYIYGKGGPDFEWMVTWIESKYDKKKKKPKEKLEKEPLAHCGVEKRLRQALEAILLAYQEADKSLLPKMDCTFYQQAEKQIEILKKNGLRRCFSFEKVKSDPKGFRCWNDGGREWREGEISGIVTESFFRGKEPVSRTKFEATLNLRQSRHIRASDRRKNQKEFYTSEEQEYICQSCGAKLILHSSHIDCPYCGAHVVQNFYDWQTERLIFSRPKEDSMVERITSVLKASSRKFSGIGIVFSLLFFPNVIFVRFMGERMLSLALCLGGVSSILLAGVIVLLPDRRFQTLKKEIVRYSEAYLCRCIEDYFWGQEKERNILEYFISALRLKAVHHTEDITTISVGVSLNKTLLYEGKVIQKKEKHNLELSRSRYPQRLKQEGVRLEEKECPSCRGNFIPDENGCCSWCGYDLHVDNAKWKMISVDGELLHA